MSEGLSTQFFLNKIWRQGSLESEDDAQMSEYTHSAEKARDTTLDDEKYDVHCSEAAWDMTSVLVMAFGDQPICCSDLLTLVMTSYVTCM